jgi:hypothetical protein
MKEAHVEKKKGSWCNDMFNIMNKYGIADQWNWKVNEENNVAVWRWWRGIQGAVAAKHKEMWQDRLMEKKKGPFYWACKKEWGEESYLHEYGSKRGRIWKTRMRASAVPLQAELHREHRSLSDKCCVCGTRAVENRNTC